MTDERLLDFAISDDFKNKYGSPKASAIEPKGSALIVPTIGNGKFYIFLDGNSLRVTRPPDSSRLTLRELLDIEFPPLEWYADRLITPGLTLLWGFAKSGKSILILHILLAIAQGGRALGMLRTKQAEVLLISLEDGNRRLQTRLRAAEAPPLDSFHVFTDWLRADKGIESLEKYLDQYPDIRVVCIDTLFLFSKLADSNDYSSTVNLMESLKRVADSRDIAIVCLHHSKKTNKETGNNDVTETALGSTGIVAGPDHLLYLKRTPAGPSDAVLYFRSKDAEPAEMALSFDHDISGWKYQGEASDLADSDERQEILNLLRDQGPLRTGAIAEALDKKVNNISYLLKRLLQKEHVRKLGYGLYALNTTESPESTETCETTESTGSEELSVNSGLSGGLQGGEELEIF